MIQRVAVDAAIHALVEVGHCSAVQIAQGVPQKIVAADVAAQLHTRALVASRAASGVVGLTSPRTLHRTFPMSRGVDPRIATRLNFIEI